MTRFVPTAFRMLMRRLTVRERPHMPPIGRGRHPRGSHPHMRSGADVPVPGFDVEHKVPAAGPPDALSG